MSRTSLQNYDAIFGKSPESAQELLLDELHERKNHTFHVVHDAAMDELAASIKDVGVLQPGFARPDAQGGYEMIAGHRRAFASRLAGKRTMPFIVKNYTDEEADEIMVYSNLSRPEILPSEKAFSYKLLYEPTKQQGKKREKDLKLLFGESNIRTIQRYIRLTYLVKPLLDSVDKGKIKVTAGTELSFLKDEEQILLQRVIEEKNVCPSVTQAVQLHKYSEEGTLNAAVIELLLSKKENQKTFTMKKDKLREYFSEEYSDIQIEEIICDLLNEWKKKNNTS